MLGFCGFKPQIIDELITLVNKAGDPPAAGLAAAHGAHGLNKMMRMKMLLVTAQIIFREDQQE